MILAVRSVRGTLEGVRDSGGTHEQPTRTSGRILRCP